MAWAKRTATDYKDCLTKIIAFACKQFEAGSVTAGTNTGTGIVYGASASETSVAETWTLTCTTAGGDGVAKFSVSGSVSGAQTAATCASPYSNSLLSFIILGGTTAFALGDSFTFDIAASTALWSVNASDLTSTQRYAMMKGVGSGSDEVFIGLRTQSDSSTYFNLEFTDFSGYVSGSAYASQPGFKSYYTCLSNVSFNFWIFMTGRSIKIVAVIGTIYEHGYAGWFLPNATPSQYGYPAFVGGSANTASTLIGSTDSSHSVFWRCYGNSSSYATGAVHDGTSWVSIFSLIPISVISFTSFYTDVLGNRVIYPITIYTASSTTIYGQLEGLYAVTNADSALTPNDILNQKSMGLIVFQDTYRTGTNNVVAIDLMGDE